MSSNVGSGSASTGHQRTSSDSSLTACGAVGRGGRDEPDVEVVHRAAVGPQNATACSSSCTGTGSSTKPARGRTPRSPRAARRRPASRRRARSARRAGTSVRPWRAGLSSTCVAGRPSTTSAPAVRWSGKHDRVSAVGVRLEVRDVPLPQSVSSRGVGGVHAVRTASASAWSHSVLASGLGVGAVEQLAQLGVEVLVAERLGRGGVLAEARAGRRGRRRSAAGRGASTRRRGPRCPGGCAASPTAWRRRAAGAAAARGRPGSAKVCSAGPPAARRRRTASCSLAAVGIRVCGGLADDLVDPALDERQRDLEPLERGLLGGGLLELEQAALEQLPASRSGWSGRCRASAPRPRMPSVLISMPRRVVGDRADQVLAQPRHVGEQPLVGGLAQREVEQHVVLR